MDLAVAIPPLPRLQPVAQLAVVGADVRALKFVERKMVRERNRVCFALEEASELIDETLASLRSQ